MNRIKVLTGWAASLALACGVHFASAQDAAMPAQATPQSTPQSTPSQNEKLTAAHDGDFIIGPTYANAPELTAKEGVPHGEIKTFTMESTESKFYPGISKTQPGTVPYHRRVSVYIPRQYVPGTPAPFMIMHDAMSQQYMPTVLDNMITDHRLPVMILIFAMSGGGDAQGSERGLEYDTVSGKFTEYIEAEMLPRVARECNVTLSSDPDARGTMGGSSGGAAAFTMGWFHPELYHRILTYSGTYVNQQSPPNPVTPQGAWMYHQSLIAGAEKKPLRVWMEVGENDNRSKDPESTLHNWVLANRRMAAALKAKGYHYQFVFAQSAGHVDRKAVMETLPEALEWLWQGYSAKAR